MNQDSSRRLNQQTHAAARLTEAFQIFEWMVAGLGAASPVPADAQTFETLLSGCHAAGALEKALEVLSWMHSARVPLTPAMYTHLANALDIAALWDQKALKPPRKSGSEDEDGTEDGEAAAAAPVTMPPGALRPAPYDGMRSIYMANPADRIQVLV